MPRTTATTYCFVCYLVPGIEQYQTQPLKRCQACEARSYCSHKCQKKDWPQHKTECKALSKDERVPERAKAVVRTRLAAPANNLNNVSFLKTSLPHLKDISISDPFQHFSELILQLKNQLALHSSVPGQQLISELEASGELATVGSVSAPLSSGDTIRISIHSQNSSALADKLPCPSYLVLHATPLTVQDSSSLPSIPGPHRRVEDLHIATVHDNLDAANKACKYLIESWSSNNYTSAAGSILAIADFQTIDGYCQGFVAAKGIGGRARWVWVAHDDGALSEEGVRKEVRFEPRRTPMMDEEYPPPPGSSAYVTTKGEMTKSFYAMLGGW